jgi:thioredoxin reductase (NADPH)
VKEFLARNSIPYRWCDLESDGETRALVGNVEGRGERLPVVFLPDGGVLVAPTTREIAARLSLKVSASAPFYDLVVIGAGPGGLAAAVYGASEGLRTLVIEREASGGQAGSSSRIENYLGFPSGISGADLARRAYDQAKRLGAEVVLPQEVREVRVEQPYKTVVMGDGSTVRCYALLISTGVSVRRLALPGEERYYGAGLYYGASLAEAANYRGKRVLVVGGGNSAGQAAMWFSKFASTVNVAFRRDSLKETMSQYLVDRIASTGNVHLLPRTELVEVKGSDRLEMVLLKDNRDGGERAEEYAAVFIFIGMRPHTAFLGDLVERAKDGSILTGHDLARHGHRPKGFDREPLHFETSVPGIFAVGDVRAGSMKRVASAVGEGAAAVRSVHEYLAKV